MDVGTEQPEPSLRSNVWSSETLQRGMANVASQPFGLHSAAFADDPDLLEQFKAILAFTDWYGVGLDGLLLAQILIQLFILSFRVKSD